MLFRISLKNIRKSMKDYAIYFFTLIVGVAIFYVFNAIEKQTVMLNITKDQRELLQLLADVLSYVSVFVSFILGFLIIYASRFLIKRRNKEFGIYLLLGMGKRKISTILFIETLMIGFISLAVGLLVGVFFSQFMSVLIANTFDADMTDFEFVFSSAACVKTIIYFGIMYLFVMVFNIFIIGKCKLIHLIQSERKSESVKMKNPVVCTIVFIISAVMLGYAYWLVTDGIKYMMKDPGIRLLTAVVLGALSTVLIFWSVSGLLLKIVMSMKKTYYKGLNSFMIRQISSKVNTTVFSMSVICLMLFITICMMSLSTSIKKSEEDGLKKYCKADIEIRKEISLASDGGNADTKTGDKADVLQMYQNAGYDLEEYLKEYVTFQIYNLYDFSGQETEEPVCVIRLSDYNKLAKLFKNKTYELDDENYMVVGGNKIGIERVNGELAENKKISINEYELTPKYFSCQDGVIDLSNGSWSVQAVVVPDKILDDCIPVEERLIGLYTADTKEEKRVTDRIIRNMKVDYKYLETKRSIYNESVGIGTMFIFIGSYIGVVLLISGAAILALKELSESADNISRYAILRKIGADEKMINKALFGQIGIFFSLPLMLACIHSIFGIRFGTYLTSVIGLSGLLPAITMTAVIIAAIYGGYFILTYLCSKSIIKNRN